MAAAHPEQDSTRRRLRGVTWAEDKAVIKRRQVHGCFHTEPGGCRWALPALGGSARGHRLEGRDLQVRGSWPEAPLGEGIWRSKHSDLLLHLQAHLAPGRPVGSQKPRAGSTMAVSAEGTGQRPGRRTRWTGVECGRASAFGHTVQWQLSARVSVRKLHHVLWHVSVAGRERGPNCTVSSVLVCLPDSGLGWGGGAALQMEDLEGEQARGST